MKLIRYGAIGQERPGVIDDSGVIRDISSLVPDISSNTLSEAMLAGLRGANIRLLPAIPSDVRLGPCIGRPSKFIGIGLNYSDHATEVGLVRPEEPVIFQKATSSLAGPNDVIVLPPGSAKTDWEVELGVVILRRAAYIAEHEAMSYVGGYCLVNDVSERSDQLERGGQWTKGKSADSFGPVGPWLVTRDEICDPQALELWLEVDGHRYQNSSTRQMIFGVSQIVSYVSRFMSLLPGDIIATGTPAGVGLAQKPAPVFLKAGQTVRLGAEGLGEQSHLCVPFNVRSTSDA